MSNDSTGNSGASQGPKIPEEMPKQPKPNSTPAPSKPDRRWDINVARKRQHNELDLNPPPFTIIKP